MPGVQLGYRPLSSVLRKCYKILPGNTILAIKVPPHSASLRKGEELTVLSLQGQGAEPVINNPQLGSLKWEGGNEEEQ